MDSYFQAMKSKGFSCKTTASVRKFDCPCCGFSFSLVYARTFACQGCSEATKGCPKVRCDKCDHEFYMDQMPVINNKTQQRILSDHICGIVNDRYDDLGITNYNR